MTPVFRRRFCLSLRLCPSLSRGKMDSFPAHTAFKRLKTSPISTSKRNFRQPIMFDIVTVLHLYKYLSVRMSAHPPVGHAFYHNHSPRRSLLHRWFWLFHFIHFSVPAL